MYKKVCCTCEVVVLLVKPIVFLTFLLWSASLDVKVPIIACGSCEIFLCGIQNPWPLGIHNTTQGIRNPTNDYYPESNFH